jgi:hypothetical protein
MDTPEHAIRERAYQLWMANGCQEGASEAHWLAAEREILAKAMSAEPLRAKSASRAAVKPRARRRVA